MVAEIELFESPDLTPLDFCLEGWMKEEDYQKEVEARDELLSRNLDAAARIKKSQDRLRRKTRDLCTRVAKFTEVDGRSWNIYCEM
jgi:hypothetical protein